MYVNIYLFYIWVCGYTCLFMFLQLHICIYGTHMYRLGNNCEYYSQEVSLLL